MMSANYALEHGLALCGGKGNTDMRLSSCWVLLLLLVAVAAAADVPPVMNFQGRLTDASANPVADGTYTLQFAIYDVATGGTPLWSESNGGVTTKNGLFSVLLGSVVNLPANIFDNPNRWFGVTVGSDAEMTPRQPFASVPSAFRTNTAQTVDDGAITASKLADSAVTTAKLADGSVTPAKLSGSGSFGGVPSGTVVQFAGASTPSGWLLCDGSAISRTGYADLFAALGVTYGAGDGTSTFNLPDLRGRVAVGLSTEPEFVALGLAGGEKSHRLSVAEMPSHVHDVWWRGVGSWASGPNALSYDNQGLTTQTQATGGGQAHNTLQPYLVINHIIKT